MARRTLIGAALGSWLGGHPQANDVAGAVQDGFDKNGKPTYVDPDTGEDVTDLVNKYGNGPMQRPSALMSIFNPEEADRARRMNEEYAAEPAISNQRNELANQHAQQAVRNTLAYLTGKDPQEIDDKLVREIQAYGGQGVTAGGTRGLVSSAEQEKADIEGGGPTTRGRLQSLQAGSGLGSEQTYQDLGGPMKEGMARANTAGATNEQAISDISLAPQRRQLNLSQLTAANEREPTVEATLDAEALNRLSRATGVEPLLIQKDVAELQGQLGRMPTEQEILNYEQSNSLFAAKNNTPLQLGVQLNSLKAQNDSAPFARQSIMNRLRQEAFSSSQPPPAAFGSPTLFKPNLSYEGGNPNQMYTPMGPNTRFLTPQMRQFMGMQQMMNNGMLGGGNGMINNGYNLSPGQLVLPNGFTAIPASAPATTGLTPPQVRRPLSNGIIDTNTFQ